MKRWIKLVGDARTHIQYDEYIGKTRKKLDIGDTMIKKVLLFDSMEKKHRYSVVMIRVKEFDDKQYDVEVV